LLCLGGTVVLPARGSFDPVAALAMVEEHGCTLFFAVPTMYQKLREVGLEALKRVRLLISGGAPCPEALSNAYAEDGLVIRQGYGLTEAGPNNFSGGIGGSVGTPLPHVRICLRTAEGREAEVGEVGELLVAGPHLMNGYWQRAESPIKDGWLHTGDLACRDAEGRYYICGRSKEMYISGGENVFPAEVEDVLGQHPDVAEVAVVGVPDAYWGEVGRAYVVLREGASAEALAPWCRAKLAAYKVPKQFVVREALPKSPVGKVLKHLLVQ
jgi:fatty-acyl-CoA synthase